MALEDALEAIRSGLSVHCHLPLNEVFVDIRLLRLQDGSIQGIIAYVPKRNVEGILSVLSETGHAQELYGLFPASLGWVPWFRWHRVQPPAAAVFPDGIGLEIIAWDTAGRVHAWNLFQNVLDEFEDPRADGILRRMGFPSDRIYTSNGRTELLPTSEDILRAGWPNPLENAAVLTAAVALEGRFDFCLDGSPPRLRTFHPAKAVVPWMVALAITAFALTTGNAQKMERLQGKIEKLTGGVRVLEQELEPMKKNVEEMQRVRTLLAGAAGFMEQRPKFYSFFNDIAVRAPGGTWISNVNYGDNQFVLQMVSPDSLKALEGLRASPLVKDVQLRGAVNRRADGKETFSVAIELKK